jgi:adenine phosphoribosyltransferase
MLKNISVTPTKPQDLERFIRTVPDFPKAGISFKDITPLLANPQAFGELINYMAHDIRQSGAQAVLGLESRGFLFASAIARELNIPCLIARKPGKLPADTLEVSYDLEYGQATLQMHTDAVSPGQKVAIVDDLLATGGTANAALKLVQAIGGEVAGCFFAIELDSLGGRSALDTSTVKSVMHF